MKKKKKRMIIYGVILAIILGFNVAYYIGLKGVTTESENVIFTINSGKSKLDIINDLKDANIIKSKFSSFIYVEIHHLKLQAGEYQLDRSNSAKDIFKQIANGKTTDEETIDITFVEGKRITDYAKIISDNFGYNYDDVIAIFKDKEFTKELISKYSFLSDEILDNDIYYPLEGYLYPDTYTFYAKSSVKEIIEKMLSQESKKLTTLKDNIDSSKYSIHEIITVASIIEMEGTNATNRAEVSQVIYKRLSLNMNLGMDTTTYYAVQKSMSDALTKSDIASTSKYNTRQSNYLGLPIGPICNPSLESITAALNPSDTDYIYFYASTDGTIYFTNSYNEFLVFKNRG